MTGLQDPSERLKRIQNLKEVVPDWFRVVKNAKTDTASGKTISQVYIYDRIGGSFWSEVRLQLVLLSRSTRSPTTSSNFI